MGINAVKLSYDLIILAMGLVFWAFIFFLRRKKRITEDGIHYYLGQYRIFYFAFFNFTLLMFNLGELIPALIANALCISSVTLTCLTIFKKRSLLAARILSIVTYTHGLLFVLYKLVFSDFGLFQTGLLSVVTVLYLAFSIISLRKCIQHLKKEKLVVNP
ncbi:MAG: hypothetical protein P0S94_01050 [Simkaniaceae bacterium]|nr:hypothetical protein [Simkaniaceae bacterium]